MFVINLFSRRTPPLVHRAHEQNIQNLGLQPLTFIQPGILEPKLLRSPEFDAPCVKMPPFLFPRPFVIAHGFFVGSSSAGTAGVAMCVDAGLKLQSGLVGSQPGNGYSDPDAEEAAIFNIIKGWLGFHRPGRVQKSGISHHSGPRF